MARLARLMLRLLAARARGTYRQTPFFDANGAPAVEVKVAEREAVAQAKRAVGA